MRKHECISSKAFDFLLLLFFFCSNFNVRSYCPKVPHGPPPKTTPTPSKPAFRIAGPPGPANVPPPHRTIRPRMSARNGKGNQGSWSSSLTRMLICAMVCSSVFGCVSIALRYSRCQSLVVCHLYCVYHLSIRVRVSFVLRIAYSVCQSVGVLHLLYRIAFVYQSSKSPPFVVVPQTAVIYIPYTPLYGIASVNHWLRVICIAYIICQSAGRSRCISVYNRV